MNKIKIDSLSQEKAKFGMKVTMVDGKTKYSFYNTKRDGGLTKAWQQFTQYGYKIGDVIEAEVKEEPETFVNDKGKTVNYVKRTILYFAEIENTPVFVNIDEPETKVSISTLTIEQRIARLEAEVFGKDKEDIDIAEF